MRPDLDLDTALRAVRRAAGATQAVQRALAAGGAGTMHKDDRSPVTVADFAAQAIVARTLAEALPADQLVGEEDARALRAAPAAALRTQVVEITAGALGEAVGPEQMLEWIDRGGAAGDAERFWALDPIDGTKGFLRGGQYAIALALIERGRVVLGVLGCPNYAPSPGAAPGLLQFATRGGGAFEAPLGAAAAPRALRVAAGRPLADSRICESLESGHSNQQQSPVVARSLGITAPPVRMDSQAKYAAIARGDAEIYMRLPTRADYREKIWDHAAGMLIVEAAGGTVTDVDGAPLAFDQGRCLERNRGVLASNGVAHDRLVAAVQQVLRA
jgi:3'(2'), 5'-bisphosphate nucleotidase